MQRRLVLLSSLGALWWAESPPHLHTGGGSGFMPRLTGSLKGQAQGPPLPQSQEPPQPPACLAPRAWAINSLSPLLPHLQAPHSQRGLWEQPSQALPRGKGSEAERCRLTKQPHGRVTARFWADTGPANSHPALSRACPPGQRLPLDSQAPKAEAITCLNPHLQCQPAVSTCF